MKTTSVLTLLFALTAFVGCKHPSQSPREAFLSRTPDRTNYHKLYEVSLESLRKEEDRVLRLTTVFTRSVREAVTNCACPDLEARLARIDRIAEKLHEPHVEFLKRLESEYDWKTDTILFFHYWAGEHQEAGYLVTRGGIVKKRFPFGEPENP